MNIQIWLQNIAGLATQAGVKILGAIVLWILGRYVAKWTVQLLTRSLTRHGFDSTLISYVKSTLTASLNVILVILILGFFGVETTTFAALFAAVGVAIGMAWSGLLANFAAGIF